MLNNILSIVPKSDGNYYFSSFGEALVYALIGFLVVVIGIVLIICIIWLIGLILRKTNNLAFLTNWKNSSKKEEVKADVQNKDVSTESDDIPDEVKAAIIAAIFAYYSEEKPKCEFKVKRIKRI